MYEDLNQLATLKYNGEVERRTRQMREKLVEAQLEYAAKAPAGVVSGHQQTVLAQIRIDCAVDLIREFANIWMGLVKEKNDGLLRKDLPFLLGKIKGIADSQTLNLRTSILHMASRAPTDYFLKLADIQMYAVVADLNRELRIAIEEHEVFSAKRRKEAQMRLVPKSPMIYSVGRRVLVGRQCKAAVVTQADDKPTQMGDFRHQVRYDDGQTGYVMSADMAPYPTPDEDLKVNNQPVVQLHIENSQIANLNLGSQLGTITAAIQTLETKDVEVANGLRELTEAVLSQQEFAAAEKQEIVELLSTIAESATKAPDQRQKGLLKAALAHIPTLIGASVQLVNLWEKLEPLVKAHLGM
jgi:hypothetical protein